NHSKNCFDNSFLDSSELCYECIDCKKCFNLKYSINCHNCSDSYFLVNCKSSKNCFGSVNLIHKEYVFLNQQLSKEEYEKKIKSYNFGQRSQIEAIKKQVQEHRLKFPYRFYTGEMNENVTGNNINQCKNVAECFDVSGLEDCKYCTWLHK